MSAPIDEVVDLLRTLRLPHMRNAAPDLLATAKAQRWEPAEAIRALLTEELAGRQASSIRSRRKAAGFPTGKTFQVWDPDVSSIPEPTQRALRTLEWVERAENLVVCGPSGTGKTHFLEALGQACVDAGHKVSWFSLEHLGALVRRHSADDTTGKAIRKIMRADVIVIDDIGLLPVTTDTAEALYRVVDAAYEKRSIALSSNLLRRAHAQNHRQRHRRPTHAPRPRRAHRRRQHPTHPSHRRQGGDTTDLTHQSRAVPLAATARNYWPPPRDPADHLRAIPTDR
jgi:DNA replication protein DnaC